MHRLAIDTVGAKKKAAGFSVHQELVRVEKAAPMYVEETPSTVTKIEETNLSVELRL